MYAAVHCFNKAGGVRLTWVFKSINHWSSIMKIIKSALLVVTLSILALSLNVLAGHGYHDWTKIKTERGDGNYVICKWKCDGIMGKDDSHTKETSGNGNCPQP